MTNEEIVIAQQTLDRLYDSLKLSGLQIPEWIKIIIHNQYSAYASQKYIVVIKDGITYHEFQIPWSGATEEEKKKWACYQQGHVKRLIEIK